MTVPDTDARGAPTDWVAVVDDHYAIRKSLTQALRVCGIAAESFESAEEYLGSGHAAKPRCIVLDIQLGGMSGIELQRELATRDSSPPAIIFMSAYGDSLSSLVHTGGVAGYLQKPFSIDELIDLVSRHLTPIVSDKTRVE